MGQRVVVRRVLPGETGPSGGPAMTDLLGVCESWSDTVAAIRAEDGTLVEIAVGDIVSGKPVPPRPSVRGRVSVRDAESHAAPLWPGVRRQALGEWELRTEPRPEGRLRKRANSCLAIGDPGTDLATAAARVQQFYGAANRAALVQVEADSVTERGFADLGWTLVPGDAIFLLGAVSRARRTLGPDMIAAELATDGPRFSATTTAGSARAAIDGDWFGVHDLVVTEGSRRQGHASQLLRTLLEAAAEQGATNLWLHVETDNAAARALYDALGLVEHHRVHYLSSRP